MKISNLFKTLLLTVLFYTLFLGCSKPEEKVDNSDKIAPVLVSSTPSNNETDVNVASSIIIVFSENIVLKSNAVITLNNLPVTASVSQKNLQIAATLSNATDYTLQIPANAISDEAGNFSKSITLAFKTAIAAVPAGKIFEAENAQLTNGAAIETSIANFSGSGYVNTNAGDISFSIPIDEDGYYDVDLRFAAIYSEKTNSIFVDNQKFASLLFPFQSNWGTIKAGKFYFKKGLHIISIIKDWGYVQIDYLKINRDLVGPTPFNFAPALVTPSPSPQAMKLYNFLKDNFGTKTISATMANYSTNIDEAVWVNSQTGKWPAMVGFDFIDHTAPAQSWVKYSAPLTLGQDWWNNNGLVTLMWHWRDPLNKSGAFYTKDTNFDVSKISDKSSNEYKAMIADIDVIAVYLKQFQAANIPVIWRPLHEASGKWFWWGAKGATPCKELWITMFDRLVNYHKINNLIWVWTSDADDSASSWYPGDNYVDIIGMDIYAGENQHASQYIAFNKVREFSNGKKIITLSECGSVPDPALMKEYGDTWSWFMPWNADFTRADKYNGATWWNKYFGYDYVITRDKMPSLK
jgi:mannan endo-1,4-beta-mannosidase